MVFYYKDEIRNKTVVDITWEKSEKKVGKIWDDKSNIRMV